MKANDILDMIGDAKGTYVWDAQQFRNITVTRRRMPAKKMWLIAAVIALTLLLVGCAVAYVLRLQDMKIGQYSVTREERYGPNWRVIEEQEKTVEVISVQGFADSPNQQAVKEARDYLESIDEEAVSDWEKKEQVARIAEKHGLKMLSDGISVPYDQSQILLDALEFSGVCIDRPYAQVEYWAGIFHPEGTFNLVVDIQPDGEEMEWPYVIHADFQYYRKGYFKYYYAAVENLDRFQEWEYTMSDGGTALLAMGEEDALILAQREDGYFCVRFDSRTGIDRMTRELMEQIADLFDFSIQPHTLTQAEMDGVRAEVEALEEAAQQESLRFHAEYEASFKKESFAAWVRQTLEKTTEEGARDLGYAFYDIDGNGVDDLLIGRDGYCTAIYWEVEGEATLFSNAAVWLYPCENQVIGYGVFPGDTDYYFSKADNGVHQGLSHIQYLPGHPEGEYRQYDLTQWGVYTHITEEEFDGIYNSYQRIPLTLQPLTEYPLETPVTFQTRENGLVADAYANESYEEKIRYRLTSPEEQWPRWSYDIRDLNGDGQEELIWQEDDRFSVYTMFDGTVSRYSMVSDGSLTICQDGIVEAVYHYGPVNKAYRYYRLEADRAVLVDYLRYDEDADPDNPWFRSPDLTGQDTTLQPISHQEAMTILANYEPLEVDLKPIEAYPFQ